MAWIRHGNDFINLEHASAIGLDDHLIVVEYQTGPRNFLEAPSAEAAKDWLEQISKAIKPVTVG